MKNRSNEVRFVKKKIREYYERLREHYERNDADILCSFLDDESFSTINNELPLRTESVMFVIPELKAYAGGITSAAMDGIKVAEAIISSYKPW